MGDILARVPINLDFEPRHDPKPDNYAHSKLLGENTRAKCQAMADAT